MTTVSKYRGYVSGLCIIYVGSCIQVNQYFHSCFFRTSTYPHPRLKTKKIYLAAEMEMKAMKPEVGVGVGSRRPGSPEV